LPINVTPVLLLVLHPITQYKVADRWADTRDERHRLWRAACLPPAARFRQQLGGWLHGRGGQCARGGGCFDCITHVRALEIHVCVGACHWVSVWSAGGRCRRRRKSSPAAVARRTPWALYSGCVGAYDPGADLASPRAGASCLMFVYGSWFMCLSTDV